MNQYPILNFTKFGINHNVYFSDFKDDYVNFTHKQSFKIWYFWRPKNLVFNSCAKENKK